jgi:hypothetical protein
VVYRRGKLAGKCLVSDRRHLACRRHLGKLQRTLDTPSFWISLTFLQRDGLFISRCALIANKKNTLLSVLMQSGDPAVRHNLKSPRRLIRMNFKCHHETRSCLSIIFMRSDLAQANFASAVKAKNKLFDHTTQFTFQSPF